jgi:hypothetical protein
MSFGGKSLNPGNINVRLGVLLGRREVAVEAGDLEALANIDGGIEDYLSVFMSAKEWQAFQTMPGYVEGDARNRTQVNEDMRARHRFMLKVARDNNVFARGEAEIGDASSLDDIIEEARP